MAADLCLRIAKQVVVSKTAILLFPAMQGLSESQGRDTSVVCKTFLHWLKH